MVPVVVGPTASGKSAAAMCAAINCGGVEIVSADSRQIYRGLDIGTAKPTAADRAAVPHHLLDLIEPTETYSAGRYAAAAREALDGVRSRGATPLVVGGSGFYVKSLLEGLTAPPASDEAYAVLQERMEREGYDALLAELRAVDPVAAAAHSPNNRVKTLRALACFMETGRRYSEFQHAPGAATRPVLEPLYLGIAPPREILYERINARVMEMVEAGLIEETRAHLDAGIPTDAPGLRTVGYAETVAHLCGQLSRDRMVEAIQQATRRYSKRQMTWFRRIPGVRWFADAEALCVALEREIQCEGER